MSRKRQKITDPRVEDARKSGRAAFAAGEQRDPWRDAALKDLLRPTIRGYTNFDANLLTAWYNGWDTATVAAPISNKGE